MPDNRSARTAGLIAGLLSTAILAGCAPLAQAPLVYSSKNSVGLDLAATSTETPGISLSLGSKHVDAAYVPVAVAVPCPKGADGAFTGCQDKAYHLSPIVGKNILQSTSSPTALRYQQAKEDYELANLKFVQASDRRRVAQAKLDQDAELAKQFVSMPAPTATPVVPGAPAPPLEPDTSQVAAKEAKDRGPANLLDVNRADGEVREAKEAVGKAKSALDDAIVAVATSNGTTLEDAYSVFGTFGGKVDSETTVMGNGNSGPKGSGAMNVGKMFSTGIASQHLASATKLQSLGQCLEMTASAMNAVKAAGLDDAAKKELLGSIASLCAVAYKNTDPGRGL